MDFYAEFKKLLALKPRISTHSRSIENSTFADYVYRTKNIYLSYFLHDAEDCYYSDFLSKARDCVDCSYLVSSELCYECVDCSDLYNCSFLQDCHNCSHVHFSIDCINCKDCFGCFGLRNQKFSIFNVSYPETEYRKKTAELKTAPPSKTLQILLPEFEKHPRLYARLLKGGERCFGDYIYFSKNCFHCFNVRNAESCAYMSDSMDPLTPSVASIDCTFSSAIELCYECEASTQCTNCNFLLDCSLCADMEYGVHCYNCHDCFGCAYLSNKEYCILNRQFTRDEYFAAIKKIKAELKENKSYGKTLAEIIL